MSNHVRIINAPKRNRFRTLLPFVFAGRSARLVQLSIVPSLGNFDVLLASMTSVFSLGHSSLPSYFASHLWT